MFGEDIITGSSIVKIDSKRRLRLPAFTKVDVGEQVIIARDTNMKDLIVYRFDLYEKLLERIMEKYNTSYGIGHKLAMFYAGQAFDLTVDKHKSIVIPKCISYDKLGFDKGEDILVTGEDYHVTLKRI